MHGLRDPCPQGQPAWWPAGVHSPQHSEPWNPRAQSAALENGHTSSGPRLYVPASQGQEITEGVMAVTIWSAQGQGLPGEPRMSWSACRGSGPGPWPSPPLPTASHLQAAALPCLLGQPWLYCPPVFGHHTPCVSQEAPPVLSRRGCLPQPGSHPRS